MWAIRSPKGFGIHPHLAEKRGILQLQATFGHTVDNPDPMKLNSDASE